LPEQNRHRTGRTNRPTLGASDEMPNDVIELTDAMLESGADAFARLQRLESGSARAAAYLIFKAMAAASPELGRRRILQMVETKLLGSFGTSRR
jgi:hypothetical protein